MEYFKIMEAKIFKTLPWGFPLVTSSPILSSLCFSQVLCISWIEDFFAVCKGWQLGQRPLESSWPPNAGEKEKRQFRKINKFMQNPNNNECERDFGMNESLGSV
jgi:hypothetical protein